MEFDNENLEQFFRKSLDRFDEQPSDLVWEMLDQKLDEDKPKLIFFNWLKYLIPAALLLLAFSAISFYQLNEMNDIEKQLSELSEENKKLKSSLAQIELEKLDQAKESQEIIHDPVVKDNPIQNTFQEIIKVIRDTIFLTKYLPNENLRNVGRLSDFSPGTLGTYSKIPSNQVTSHTFSEKKLSSSKLIDKQEIAMPIPKLGMTQQNPFSLAPEKAMGLKLEFASSRNLKKRKKKKAAKGPVIISKHKPWGTPEFYYRPGLSTQAANCLKGEFSNSSVGFGIGLLQEYGLTTRFALTTGVFHIFQEYALSNNGLPITENEIKDFPQQENYIDQITRVEVENKFYEIPLGFKYDFYQDSRKSFFFNPSIKWSIHRPQQFSYFLTENRLINIDSNQRFAYLNMLNFSVGMEKYINPFMAYQLILGYDQSVEPTGIEKQNLNSLHLRFNLLFGKK